MSDDKIEILPGQELKTIAELREACKLQDEGVKFEYRDRLGEWKHIKSMSFTNPLQAEYRRAPDPVPPKRVPLEPQDIPPGSALRLAKMPHEWFTVLNVVGQHIYWAVGTRIAAREIASLCKWEIERPGEDWKPCYKEV